VTRFAPPTSGDEGGAASNARSGRQRGTRLAWISGAFLLVALVLVVSHVGEERRFAELARGAKPGWLLVAALLQAGTYFCAAAVWQRALQRARAGPRFLSLVPLGLAKLFTDQAVPSAGMSGTVLVVRALVRRGIPRGQAAAAMLVGLAAFYIAYALAVGAGVAALWVLGGLDRLLLVLASALALLAGAVPAAVLGFGGRFSGRLPRFLKRLPGARQAVSVLSEVPRGSLWGPRLAAETVGLQLGVFLLDAATLAAMLLAVSAPAPPEIVFASFVFASVVATLAFVPGGLGTFEGTCVAMLSAHGVAPEASLAATLLLRGFTFWLPMLPGLWLARREMGPRRAAP